MRQLSQWAQEREALPAVVAVELVQVAQQVVGGGVDACGQLGNLVTEPVQVRWLGSFRRRRVSGAGRRSATLHRRPVSGLSRRDRARGQCGRCGLGPRDRGSCRGLGRRRPRVVFHDDAIVHPDFDRPLTPRGAAESRLPGSRGHLLRGDRQGHVTTRSEPDSGRVGHGAESDARNRVNPKPGELENSWAFFGNNILIDPPNCFTDMNKHSSCGARGVTKVGNSW